MGLTVGGLKLLISRLTAREFVLLFDGRDLGNEYDAKTLAEAGLRSGSCVVVHDLLDWRRVWKDRLTVSLVVAALVVVVGCLIVMCAAVSLMLPIQSTMRVFDASGNVTHVERKLREFALQRHCVDAT